MITVFTVLGTLSSFVALYTVVRYIKRTGRLLFLHLVLASLCLTNGLGLVWAPYSDFVLEYSPASNLAYDKAGISMTLFCGIMLGLYWFLYLRPQPRRPVLRKFSLRPQIVLMVGGLILLTCGAALRFLVFSGAYEQMGAAFSGTSGVGTFDHYAVRQAISNEYWGAGKGAFTASVALYTVAPTAISVLILIWLKKRLRTMLVLVGVLWATQIALALSFAQRAPLLIAIVQPLCAWGLLANVGRLREIFSKKLVKAYVGLSLILTVVGGMIYVQTDEISFVEGVSLLYSRVFLVPVAASSYVYELFPDSMSFRGVAGVFGMGDETQLNADVNFGDVSLALTGYRWGVNSCLVTVAYSGLGFVGVILVSFVCFGLCYLLDSLASSAGPEAQILAICASLHIVGPLGNCPLLSIIVSYGGWVSALLAVLIYRIGLTRVYSIRHPSPANRLSRLYSEPGSGLCSAPR